VASRLQELQFDDYLRTLFLHKKLVMGLTLFFGLAGTLWVAQQPNIYQASTRILIETEAPRVVQFQEMSSAQPWDRTFLQTEYRVITSRAVLSRVAEELHLASFPPFSEFKDPIEKLDKMITIDPVRATKLVDIRVAGTKPDLIARIANGVADAYAKVNLDRRREMTTGGVQWLQEEVDKMETRMKESQLKLQEFREQHGTIDLGEDRQASVIQRIQALNVSLSKTREDRIEAETKYREKHPNLQELLNKEKELQLALFDQEQQALEMSRLSIQFNGLMREAKTSESIYNILLTRLKELSVQEGLQSNNVQVVDYALVPTRPTGPWRSRNIVLSALLGFLAGLGFALMIDLLTKTVRTRQDFELLLEIPFLGHIPQLALDRGRGKPLVSFLEKGPRSPVVENIRSIRTTLEFLLPAAPSHVLLITSALPEEGKSVVSSNLALSLHELGRKVLLIDADLRRPALYKYLQVNLEPGLSNYLKGDCDWPELLQEVPGVEGFPVIASGMTPEQPTDALSQPRFQEFLNACRERYQYILIDSPPVLVAADSAVISTFADGTLYVVRANRTHSEAVLTGKRRLADVGAKLIGGILNGARLELERGYRYYYSSRYEQQGGHRSRKSARPPPSLKEAPADSPSGSEA